MSHRNGSRLLQVKALSRVEGEGALHVEVVGEVVRAAQLQIYEPPRFFEAFLQGRSYTEPPDITARICGICPVAYQMSSCLAMEDACGVVVPDEITALRQLLYCGEWIESHALHIYLLHAPDFLGYDGAIEMAADHRALVQSALRLKKLGNMVLEVVGGRAIHPINVKLGGFYRSPSRRDLTGLLPELRWALQASLDTVDLVSGFSFPDLDGEWELVGLTGADQYPMMGYCVSTSGGLQVPVSKYGDTFTEEHVEHSTALHGSWSGGQYAVGPLARYSLNYDRLTEPARRAAERAGLGSPCRNPYRSIIVRAVELVEACQQAIDLIEDYVVPEAASVPVPARAGVGHGISEAPRGLLYHRYEIDDEGTILTAQIMPPTSQNQPAIEHDLMHIVQDNLDLDDLALTSLCEQTIRNYDPCISCATHFLDLNIMRG